MPSLWNPSQVVKLIQPTLVNGKRVGLDPYTGAILPAVTKNIRALEQELGTALIRRSAHGVELTSSYTTGDFTFYGSLGLARQKAEKITSAQFNFSPDDQDTQLVALDGAVAGRPRPVAVAPDWGRSSPQGRGAAFLSQRGGSLAAAGAAL